MRAIRIAIEQPITVAVGVILSLIAGFVALDRVPIQMTPEVEDTVIAVTTRWENASPQEIESEIVDEQEERLQLVAGLDTMTSTSSRGQAVIRLEFATGTDKDVALREVGDKLREVPDYPENVDEPVIEATDPESRDYIAWYVVTCTDPDVDVRTLRDFVDARVKPRLERLPGMAEVNILGGRERETQIRIDPARLAQRGVTVPQFVAAIRAQNQNSSAGALAQGKSDIRVRTVGRFASPEQVENVVVRQDESGIVYVGDVAEVVETYKEPAGFVRNKGQVALAMNFQREPGSNVLEVMEGLVAEVERINAKGGVFDTYCTANGIDGELSMRQAYDQTTYVYQALDLVQSNLLIGGALATVILLLFLRSVRSVGIVALAIPISVIGAVVAMVGLGRSVNVISLAGMAFAVGMVVDNAIVVIENIFRHLEAGKSPGRAAYDGAREVAGAVFASTMTTVVVFIPILLIEKLAGQLFRDIALAICSAVLLSYVVSILVIPTGAALLLRRREGHRRKEGASGENKGAPPKRRIARVRAAFARVADVPGAVGGLVHAINGSWLARGAVILVLAGASVAGSWFLLPPVDYLPQGNRNIVFGLMIPPPGYNLDQLAKIGERVEGTIEPFWRDDVDRAELPAFPASREPDAPKIVPPKLANYFFVAAPDGLFHGGISRDDEKAVDLIPLFDAATAGAAAPGTLAFAFQFPLFRLGGSTGSAVKIDLSGADLDQVSDSAGALFGALVQEFGPQSLQPSPPNFNLPAPELRVIPDQERMTDLGLTVADVALAVQAASDGAYVGDYQMPDELVDLRVIDAGAVDQETITYLPDVPIATPEGSVVSLGDVTKLEWVSAPERIRRVGRQRAVTLEFTAPTGMPLQQATETLSATIADLRAKGAIAGNVDVDLAGTASKLDEILAALLGDGSVAGLLRSSLFLAFLVVYLLMCVLFQSWIFPLVIMFSVPLATFGGFVGLWIAHETSVGDRYLPVQNLDILTILGFVILAGVVVNNAILIVAQTQNFLRHGDTASGHTAGISSPRDAISRAVRSRVRPIFMSMLTSVGGMLPLVVTPGSGSELYRGLGAVVVGGLVMSTVFTLVLVPTLLGVLYDAGGGKERGRSRVDDGEDARLGGDAEARGVA